MHIIDSLILGFFVCALINAPMVMYARKMRRLAQAKLGIIKTVSKFEEKLLDGTLKNGEGVDSRRNDTISGCKQH